MTKAQIKLRLLAALREYGLNPTDVPPSQFLDGLGDWDDVWQATKNRLRGRMTAGVWEGGLLPHGRPAPAEAVPGAAYYIVLPSRSILFQYSDTPFTPGGPGPLTPDNVEEAMNAHLDYLAEQLALEELLQSYMEWVAERL